jgi:hypothetical protein
VLFPVQDRLVDQASHQLKDVLLRDVLVGAGLLDGFQVEPAGEYRQPRPQNLFLGRAEFVAPLHRRPQCLVTLKRGLAPPGQQAVAVIEPFQDLLRRQHPRPRRSQLDRQRDPIQPLAQASHYRTIVWRDGETRHHGGRPLGEQSYRLVLDQGPRSRMPITIRDRQWGHLQDLLTLNVEELPARGEDPQTLRVAEQLGGQDSARIAQMLAVVQHQQQLLVRQILQQRVSWQARGVITQSQCRYHGLRHQPTVPKLGQISQPHPIRERPTHVGRQPQRQPCLAHPADTCQRQQPSITQEPPGL